MPHFTVVIIKNDFSWYVASVCMYFLCTYVVRKDSRIEGIEGIERYSIQI